MQTRNYELLTFPNPQALARDAASQWLEQVRQLKTANFYGVALAGGRIAVTFLQTVSSLAQAGKVSLNAIHFFWGDERCVPPTSPDSNFRLARENLLDPLGIAASQIHRVRGEADPAAAAAEAAADLCGLAGRNPSGQPVLDLILLGLGENGHIASLFPEEPPEMVTDQAVYRPVLATKPPPRRITLGYPAINAARQVWVLASGAGKEEALRESLAPDGRTPLGRVMAQRINTRIFTEIRLS